MVTTTNKDYDLGETTKAVRSQLIGLAIVCLVLLLSLASFPIFVTILIPLVIQ